LKRANLPHQVGTLIFSAAAAGQLGRISDARASFDGLRRHHPAYVDPDKAGTFLATWIWDHDIIDQMVDGFLKAKALDAAPGTPAPSSSAHRSPVISDSGKVTASGIIARANPDSAVQAGYSASIAVLPFTDMSAAKDQDWFCDEWLKRFSTRCRN
jgi:hypothetical protein